MTVRTRIAAIAVGIVVASASLSAVSCAPAGEDHVVRHTSLGFVRGLDESRSTGTLSWLGIPLPIHRSDSCAGTPR
jgi:para-nitrobenzyl esterase